MNHFEYSKALMEILLLVSILFQLTAGIIAIRLIRITGSYKAWLLLIIVIFLMMARRIITLNDVLSGKIKGNSITEAEITALIISILLSTALYLMIPIFRRYRDNEQELNRKNKALAKAKKMAEEGNALKTSFLQNLSHEIRTPMNGILGFSDLLIHMGIEDSKQKKYLEIIKQNGEQLYSIVSDLQTISHLNSQKIKISNEEIAPRVIIENLYSTFLQTADDAGITLKTNIPDSARTIVTDKTKLTQVLTNLLSNALKFTHEGSVEFGYQFEANSITFFVKDSGIGMTPKQQKLIFERFAQADDSISKKYGGAGLGLSISKGIVELLGGDISVKSEPGSGSEFSFWLPIGENKS